MKCVSISGVKKFVLKEKNKPISRDGSVIVDVAIDQGGNVETVDKLTTHQNPI